MEPLINTLKSFGKIRLAIMATVAVGLIAAFALIAIKASSPALSPLYTNLAPEDSAKIASELGKLGVPYDVDANGSVIRVPSERVLRLRMTMAQVGLPSNGSVVGYEIFDKSETFGSSNFVLNVNMLRALEGELARTIGSFNQVESARVHLVVPKRELFTREKQDPSASVALKLRGAQELSKQEVAAITNFVAAAVPGLKPSHVTVVDNNGRLLARGDGQDTVGAIATATEEYRVAYENRTREMIEELIGKIVGPGKVKVQVAADINFDRVVIDSEKFDPEGQVARSVQSTSGTENSSENEGKDSVTVANQLPGAQNGGHGGSTSKRNNEKSDEITNYEISKVTQKQVKEGGSINRLSLAVLVDGTYTEDATGKKVYSPRSDEELKRLETLVRSAIVFDEKRGDTVQVVNMPFTQTEEVTATENFLDVFKHQMEGIIQTLIIAGVAVLAILLVLRPAILHLMKHTAPAERGEEGLAAIGGATDLMRLPSGVAGLSGGSAAGAFAGTGGEEEDDGLIDLENVKGRLKSSTVKKVMDAVDKNPDETMGVVRQWMIKEAS